MTPYAAFKKSLIQGVLTHKVFNIAAMIMIDEGKCPFKEVWTGAYICDYQAIRDWLLAMNMPEQYLMSGVSVYLATYYPLTYQAFLDGKSKDVLCNIIMKEKKKKKSSVDANVMGKREGRYYQRKKDSGVVTIKARSLDKAHDWNTVK